MKSTLILSLFFISILLTNINAKFLPEEKDVQSTTVAQEFNKVNEKSSSSFNAIESNTTSIIPMQTTQINETADKFGKNKLDKDLNISKIEDIKGYSDISKKTIAPKAGALFQKLSGKIGGVETGNMETLKSEYITQKEANSSEARAILFNKRFYKKARSLVANLKTIDCYITRKLVNSYYCPLPGMENSFFKGGAAKDSNDEAKRECEKLCSIPVRCLHKSMNKDLKTSKDIGTVLGKNDSENVYIDADNTMLPKYVEIKLHNQYLYADNVSFSSSEYNATKALKILQETNHGARFDASYLDENNHWTKIESGLDVKLSNINSSFKIYLPSIRTKRIKITAHTPYIVDVNTTERTDNKLETTFVKINIKYSSNNWWFCPEINIITNAADCDGKIKSVNIGSQVYTICVEEGRKNIEPTYGAFFTQDQCESSCKNTARCVPTYKHLSNIDPYNLPSSLKDVEVGCVDNPSNTSCTQALCMDYFQNDVMPFLEKSWTNDDKVVTTVASGIPSKTIVRPRIDVKGGISANGSKSARMQSEIKEMSEISYMNMLKTNTYDISKYKIGVNIPPKNAYVLQKNNSGSGSLVWRMRPWSYDIDSKSSYYIYILFDVFSRFKPIVSVYKNADGSTPDWLDRTFILKTPMSYKIIRRIENYEVQTLDANTTKKSWNRVNSMMIDKYETFNGIDFSVFDMNANAEYYKKVQFKSDKSWEEFVLYNSIEEMSSTPGVFFHSQNTQGNGTMFDRIFTGDTNKLTASYFQSMNVFGIYSKTKLSYKVLFDLISDSNRKKHLIFSTISKTNKYLHSDGAYDLDRTRMYISGKLKNMSVKVNFTPLPKEEGKKAFIFMLLYDDNVSK